MPRVLGTSALRSPRQRFDELFLGVVTDIEERWQAHLPLIEYAVEEAPLLPDDWGDEVPLATLVRAHGDEPARLVVFRRTIEHRAETRSGLDALVLTVVVEQMAELLGLSPSEVDPRYRDEE
jgi:predicted Zn-dependent protease with MMP-like domain